MLTFQFCKSFLIHFLFPEPDVGFPVFLQSFPVLEYPAFFAILKIAIVQLVPTESWFFPDIMQWWLPTLPITPKLMPSLHVTLKSSLGQVCFLCLLVSCIMWSILCLRTSSFLHSEPAWKILTIAPIKGKIASKLLRGNNTVTFNFFLCLYLNIIKFSFNRIFYVCFIWRPGGFSFEKSVIK